MNIKYLSKLKENLSIAGTPARGSSESEIKAVEAKFNIKFPQAYREYLLLAGEYKGGLIITSTSLKTVSSDWFHEIMQELMTERSISINKPYWIFAHEDDFFFFYLEEGVEDPLVYRSEPRSSGDPYGYYILPCNMSFSKFISACIDYSIKGHDTGIF